MADDDIERLLREVDAMTDGGGGGTPAARSGSVARKSPAQVANSGRIATATRTGVVAGAVSGSVVGVGTFLLSWLPLIDNPVSSGLGAFIGAFLTGTVLKFRSARD